MMKEKEFLNSLDDLTGKVAVVVGGTQGIGKWTVIYLAARGATVYACAPDLARERDGVKDAEKKAAHYATALSGRPEAGDICFHALDLSSVSGTIQSLGALIDLIRFAHDGRIDTIVNNAGIASSSAQLSPDNYDLAFAVNCLGNYVFLVSILEFAQECIRKHQNKVRFTIVSSAGHKALSKLNYDRFTEPITTAGGSKRSALLEGILRYLNSKLAVLYLALEFARRVEEDPSPACRNILVNVVHPGNAAYTQIGAYEQGTNLSPSCVARLKSVVFLGGLLSYTTEDAAKTQTFVAAHSYPVDEDITGAYWEPSVSLIPLPGFWMRYRSCKPVTVNKSANNRDEWGKLWNFCHEAMTRALQTSNPDEIPA